MTISFYKRRNNHVYINKCRKFFHKCTKFCTYSAQRQLDMSQSWFRKHSPALNTTMSQY